MKIVITMKLFKFWLIDVVDGILVFIYFNKKEVQICYKFS